MTRFLWVRDPKGPLNGKNIIVYRFQTIVFGATSSPFLLAATINHHLHNHPNPLARELMKNVYVDNILTNAKSVSEAIEQIKISKEIFKECHMNLREFVSANKEINAFLESIGNPVPKKVKFLGIEWNTEDDTIEVTTYKPLNKEPEEWTKRFVLRAVAKIYDPLGQIVPKTIKAKKFVQNLWKENQKWDQALTQEQASEWKSIQEQLRLSNVVKTQRRWEIEFEKEYQLHLFSDASTEAYACVGYLKEKTPNSKIIHFLCGKSRLSPIKKVTVPRLELMGATIAANLGKTILEELSDLKITQVFIWTDSMIVLNWLKTHKMLPIFISNRVKSIQKSLPQAIYKYTPTESNPADLATRTTDKSADEVVTWLNGPKWLKSEGKWPNQPEIKFEIKDLEDPIEEANTVTEVAETESIIKFERFSNWNRIVNSMIYILKFIHLMVLKKLQVMPFRLLEINELFQKKTSPASKFLKAEKYLFKIIQQEKSPSKNTIDNLSLFFDNDGLLRCNTRLVNSDLNPATKYPIYLPKDHFATKLYVLKIHKLLLHASPMTVVISIRAKVWIPNIRTIVKKAVKELCRQCQNKNPFKMPPFPPFSSNRVINSRPFETVGIDYFGPKTVKVTQKIETKAWGCLFTCYTTRAIHLEIVYDLSTLSFLQAFRRMISRRGTPSTIFSDNQTTFHLARKAIKVIWQEEKEMQSFASTRGIEWKFITPANPAAGGLWERMVGITKNSLKKAIGHKILSLPEFMTVLTEVEGIVNSRPLVYVPSEENGNVIRPIDCIQPNARIGIPSIGIDNPEDLTFKPSPTEKLLDLWNKQQVVIEKFWEEWKTNYLTNLHEDYQREHKQGRSTISRKPKIGEIVHLQDDSLEKGKWELAKIIEIPSETKVRLLKSNNEEILRSIKLICPLELDPKIEEKAPELEPTKIIPEKTVKLRRSGRIAARQSHFVLLTLILIQVFVPLVIGQIAFTEEETKILSSYKRICKKIAKKNQDEEIFSQCDQKAIESIFVYRKTHDNVSIVNNLTKFAEGNKTKTTKKKEVKSSTKVADNTKIPDDTKNPTTKNVIENQNKTCTSEDCAPWRWSCCSAMQKTGMLIWIFFLLSFLPTIIFTLNCVKFIGKIAYKLIFKPTYNHFMRRKQTSPTKSEKTNSTRRNRLKRMLLAIFMLNKFLLIHGCSETATMIADSTQCSVNEEGKEKCILQKTAQLTIHPVGETSCIKLKFPTNETEILEIKTLNIEYQCNFKEFYYTRDFSTQVESVHRCRNAQGSNCFEDWCESVKTDSDVNEFSWDVRQLPGSSFCKLSCQCASCNGCFLCQPSCLFYRVFAKPETSDIYTIGSCPTWTLKVKLELKFQEKTQIIELNPMFTKKTMKAKFTLQAVTVPQLPILNQLFLRKFGTSETATVTASAPEQPVAGTLGTMQCPSYDEAKSFDCPFPPEICLCTPSDYSASCSCNYKNPKEFIDKQEYKLPLRAGPLYLQYKEGIISASLNQQSGILLHVAFENVSISMRHHVTECQVSVEKQIKGCRACYNGAQALIKCESKLETTLDIQCEKGNEFKIPCNNKTHEIDIMSQEENYNKSCQFECSNSKGEIKLYGKLETISINPFHPRNIGGSWAKAATSVPINNILNEVSEFFTSMIQNIFSFLFNHPFLFIFIIILVVIICLVIYTVVKIVFLPETFTFKTALQQIKHKIRPKRQKVHVL